MKPKKEWPISLFRRKYQADVKPGELVWSSSWPDTKHAYGPYRVKRVETGCPGQFYVQIVGMEGSGLFQMAYAPVLVPRYR